MTCTAQARGVITLPATCNWHARMHSAHVCDVFRAHRTGTKSGLAIFRARRRQILYTRHLQGTNGTGTMKSKSGLACKSTWEKSDFKNCGSGVVSGCPAAPCDGDSNGPWCQTTTKTSSGKNYDYCSAGSASVAADGLKPLKRLNIESVPASIDSIGYPVGSV